MVSSVRARRVGNSIRECGRPDNSNYRLIAPKAVSGQMRVLGRVINLSFVRVVDDLDGVVSKRRATIRDRPEGALAHNPDDPSLFRLNLRWKRRRKDRTWRVLGSHIYSFRRATIGSMRDARCAGIKQARAAIARKITETTVIVER